MSSDYKNAPYGTDPFGADRSVNGHVAINGVCFTAHGGIAQGGEGMVLSGSDIQILNSQIDLSIQPDDNACGFFLWISDAAA